MEMQEVGVANVSLSAVLSIKSVIFVCVDMCDLAS